jgi:hypothetical protein
MLRSQTDEPYGPRFWQDHCGFLDYSGAKFREVQESLLLEQLGELSQLPAGQSLLNGSVPRSISEFRETTPLTVYEDYAHLIERMRAEDRGSCTWAFTQYGPGKAKWAPYTARAVRNLTRSVMASIVLAAAEKPGQVRVRPGDRVVYNVPPRPYLAGIIAFELAKQYGMRGLISPEEAEKMEFRERTQKEFMAALEHGIDILVSMTSVLTRVSERFASGASGRDEFSHESPGLRGTGRYALASLKSRIARRRLKPGDLWKPKAIVGWGLDTRFFGDQIAAHWGRPPFELYACTEVGAMGVQYRRNGGIALNPEACYFEFIPEAELEMVRNDSGYTPRTALLDEVEAGGRYEVVVTNFYGMPFVRYRTGHIVRFTNASTAYGLELEYVGRADDRIDIGGFTRIDEATVWQSLADTGAGITDWVLRRELNGQTPELHMYAEARGTVARDVTERLHAALRTHDPLYADVESMLGMRPLKVTLLNGGTFDRYYDHMRKAGAELMARRPRRMNSDDETVELLLGLSGLAAAEVAA